MVTLSFKQGVGKYGAVLGCGMLRGGEYAGSPRQRSREARTLPEQGIGAGDQ